jgi:hypothetical protein
MLAALVLAALTAASPHPRMTVPPHQRPAAYPSPTTAFCAARNAGQFEGFVLVPKAPGSPWLMYYVACSNADYRWNGKAWEKITRWPHV